MAGIIVKAIYVPRYLKIYPRETIRVSIIESFYVTIRGRHTRNLFIVVCPFRVSLWGNNQGEAIDELNCSCHSSSSGCLWGF